MADILTDMDTPDTPWWTQLYDRQHAIWSAWSDSEGDAEATVDWIEYLVGSSLEGSQPRRLLDLGCGVGREICSFARRGWECHGIDISSNLVDKARRRAQRLGVADRTSFEVADLRTVEPPSSRFDVVLFWDSTLAIWPAAEQEALLQRWRSSVREGGWLIVEQLAREHYSQAPDSSVTLEGPTVGPGRTERTYHWDEEHDVLLDRVVWHPPHGQRPEVLPSQRLHLLAASDLVVNLEQAGLREVRALGSTGWNWVPPDRQPPDVGSRRVVVFGRTT